MDSKWVDSIARYIFQKNQTLEAKEAVMRLQKAIEDTGIEATINENDTQNYALSVYDKIRNGNDAVSEVRINCLTQHRHKTLVVMYQAS